MKDYQCTSSLSGRSTCPDVKIGKPVVNLTKTEKAPMNVQVAAIMMFSVMAIIQNKNKIKDQLICSENNDLESTKTTVEVLDENKIEDSLNYKENDDFESTKTTVEVQNKNKIKDQLICSENNDLENTRTIVEDTRTTDKNMEKRTKYENDKKMHETIASEHLPNPSQQERKKKPDAGLDRIQFYGRYTLYDTISDIDLT
ncbi:unnamed protein product [Mytilus coruscus]|uniref:Uncharacterized protein n=1 Tax=Mytilus coruscus TaxID=42192 RepID=A0A6J8CRP0_MYTCO|nr:unnamed protein product [Mytilus coruscus]